MGESKHLVASAFMQALSQCESEPMLQKMVERFDAHKGTLAIEDRRNCEEAINRQVDYIHERLGQKPNPRKVVQEVKPVAEPAK